MFGFLFLVFIILAITCSETTVLLCYFHLCAEVCYLTNEKNYFLKISEFKNELKGMFTELKHELRSEKDAHEQIVHLLTNLQPNR